jgi:hypothetical protein
MSMQRVKAQLHSLGPLRLWSQHPHCARRRVKQGIAQRNHRLGWADKHFAFSGRRRRLSVVYPSDKRVFAVDPFGKLRTGMRQ